MSKRTAKLIFEKWKSDFVNFDKKRDAVRANFDKLFGDLYDASIDFDIAYSYIEDAARRHIPRNDTAKWVWKSMKKFTASSYEDWLNNWREDIKSKCFQSFYDFYEIQEADKPKEKKTRKFGSMSAAEYKRQRAYADSFETLPSLKEKIDVNN